MGGRGGTSGFNNKKQKSDDTWNLSGSEKQISYAKDIIKNVENTMKEYLKQNSGHPMEQQVKDMIEKISANMRNSYAGDIIEDFSSVPKMGNAEERFKKLISLLGTAHKIKGRNYRK